MARNRVIYQSEALFVSKGTKPPINTHADTDIQQLHRVQSANYGFSVSRQNINQFGNLARIDSIMMEAPQVTLDFSYYLHTGNNEAALGFSVGSNISSAPSFISGIVDANSSTKDGVVSGRNFHILTVPEGNDANGSAAGVYGNENTNTISIGNAFITNYSVEAAVGGIPTVSVGVEGLNINVCTGHTGVVPSLTLEGSQAASTYGFTLPVPSTGDIGITALRPGDITLSIGDGILTDLPDADAGSNNTASHIQSFSIEIPIGRSTLQRLGSKFGYAKVIDFPVEVTVNVSATVADLKNSGALESIRNSDAAQDLTFTFKKNNGTDTAIIYKVKNAKLVSENFSSSIGDNKSVDIVFTATIGGPQDGTNGVFVALAA